MSKFIDYAALDRDFFAFFQFLEDREADLPKARLLLDLADYICEDRYSRREGNEVICEMLEWRFNYDDRPAEKVLDGYLDMRRFSGITMDDLVYCDLALALHHLRNIQLTIDDINYLLD